MYFTSRFDARYGALEGPRKLGIELKSRYYSQDRQRRKESGRRR